MSDRFERLWVALLDSARFRQFARTGIGARFFQGRIHQQVNLARRYVTSDYQSRKTPDRFQDVRTYCTFIGHNKSGASMLGSLLDAHANVILSDEVDALQFVSAGFRRDQIFHLLLKGSRREAMKGRVTARRLTPYSYRVPGQWQGRYSCLRVIGDSTTGTSTRRFAEDPALVDRLQKVMAGIDLKFIQVIRNPFDPISVMMVRGKRTFENSIGHYFARCETLVELRRRLDDSSLLPVRYEDFVLDAKTNLRKVCRFLGVEAEADYVEACTCILFKAPDQRRHMVEWEPKWIKVVEDKLGQFDFLQGYSFES